MFGERFEGWEWIVTLIGPNRPKQHFVAHAIWVQDVQMREDGSVVVVSGSKRDYMLISPPELISVNLAASRDDAVPEYQAA